MSTSQIGQIGLTEFASNLDARLTAVEQSGGGSSSTGIVCTVCTREEYEALTEYDQNTIYFIRG